MKTVEAILISLILYFWHCETLIHQGYLFLINTVPISVQRIIVNGIIPLKCQPPSSGKCFVNAKCL